MAKADVISITTRRKLLGVMASAPVMAAPPVEATTADPHLAWLQEGLAARDLYNASDDPEIEERYSDLYTELRERIVRTPPTTAVGVAAQLMVLVDALHEGVDYSGATTRRVLGWAGPILPVPAWIERSKADWEA